MNKIKKTIVLAMPQYAGIDFAIQRNLEFHGFNVINLSELSNINEIPFRYPSVLSRIKVFFQREILGNKQAKQQLKLNQLRHLLESKLPLNTQIDYALFIRADVFSDFFIDYVRKIVHSNNGSMISYQYDGILRFPKILDKFKYFDKFYIFDYKDFSLCEQNLLPTTNFYLDYHIQDNIQLKSEYYDFYYLGSDTDDRVESINILCNYFDCNQYKYNFSLATKNCYIDRYKSKNIKFINYDTINFEENIKLIQSSQVLVDFVISEHNGLSFRIFEALGLHKKLITTNNTIRFYDFYHPNNIFIWNGKDLNIQEFENFLSIPYYELDDDIYIKYSFYNWIKYILDIKPHIPITLPNYSIE